MSLVGEFRDFMRLRKKFWVAPILMVPVSLSGFMIVATASPIVQDFIYPLF